MRVSMGTVAFLAVAFLETSVGIAQEQVDRRQVLTITALEGEYLGTFMERVEDQYGDFMTWFPSNRLDRATLLTIAEYENGVAFVCFSQGAPYFEIDGRPHRVTIDGPAVVFPVFPDDGESKFKNNRYVGSKKKADWAKRDRHFWDEGVEITFTHETGGHGRLVRVVQFTIADRRIGEEQSNDDGTDTRMTDRQRLQRLMGVYFNGRL